MNTTVHTIEYKDKKSLNTELLFIIACERVAGRELVNVRLSNTETGATFRNSAAALLRAMKREGVITLFVFEDELRDQEKTESIYLVNKYPALASAEACETGIYIKL